MSTATSSLLRCHLTRTVAANSNFGAAHWDWIGLQDVEIVAALADETPVCRNAETLLRIFIKTSSGQLIQPKH